MDFSGLERKLKKHTESTSSGNQNSQGNPPVAKKPLGPMGRFLYRALGVLLTAAGIIGIVVPVWPTTIFLILASAVFLKSSPEMYQWLHRNRILGPYLQAYTDKTGISMGYKIWTISILWLSIGFSAIFAVSILWVRIMLFGIAVAVTIHVATLKTRRKEDEIAAVDPLLPPSQPVNLQEVSDND